jgi:hypothetical protein
MARLAALALLLTALAGCTATPTAIPATDGTAQPAAPAVGFEQTATLWLPMTTGANMTETSVPFRLNGTADLHVTLRLASSLTPVSAAMAMVELRDARSAILAQAMFMPPGMDPNQQTLMAANATAGMYTLHFSTRGGSDGSAHGDYIEYRIQAQQAYVAAPDSPPSWKATA